MKKTVESIEKEISTYLESQQAAVFSEDYGIQWIEYYYTDDGDYSASVRMRVEDYVKDLICDVEMPVATRDDDDDDDDDDDYDYDVYDDYDGCTEDWEIKLCVHYGVHSRDDLDWGTIIVDVESESVGSYIVYQLAEQIAEQRAEDEEAVITEDVVALAKKIDNAREWDLDDCKTLCEALDMGDEWEAANGETFEAVAEKAVAIALKDSKPVYLSVDNGASYIAADEDAELQAAIDKVGWGEIVSFMDDDARVKVHYDVTPFMDDVAPCTDLEFLKHYLEIAPCDLVIG